MSSYSVTKPQWVNRMLSISADVFHYGIPAMHYAGINHKESMDYTFIEENMVQNVYGKKLQMSRAPSSLLSYSIPLHG